MSNITFANNYINTQATSSELKKKLQSEQNFGAIDGQKIKQDTVEVTQKAVKENFIVKTLRETFGVKDPKKMLNSIALTILTVVGIGVLGNKSTKLMANLGQKLDDVLLDKNKFAGKIYGAISEFLSSTKNKTIENLKKFDLFNDIAETFKNRKAKPKLDMAKGQGRGFSTMFSYTTSDIAKTSSFEANREVFNSLKKHFPFLKGRQKAEDIIVGVSKCGDDKNAAIELLKNTIKNISDDDASKYVDDIIAGNSKLKTALESLIGEDVDDYFYKEFIGISYDPDRKKFADKLTQAIASKNGVDLSDKKALKNLLLNLKDGKIGDDIFRNIEMNRESAFMGGWQFSEFINKGLKKLGILKEDKFRGNLGEALLKYNMSSGNLAKTAPGKLLQNSILIPSESISNFVCDGAGMNFFLIPMIYNLFNTAQEAPKGQKAATIADDWIGSIGNLAITMPASFATTYGLATLANIKGTGLGAKALRTVGKFFNMGLKENAGKLSRCCGGFLRFVLIMFTFNSMFSKPLNALVHKIFGKPYDPDEAAKLAQLEEEKKQIIPELGITQGELIEKMEKNPQALQKIQTDEQLAKALEQNPKLLLDLLDNKEIVYPEVSPTPASQGQLLSPINQTRLSNQTNAVAKNNSAPNLANASQNVDSATYIPSSEFNASSSTLSPEIQERYNAVMLNADKALKRAESRI